MVPSFSASIPSFHASNPFLPRFSPNLLNPHKSHPSPNHSQSPQPASILSPASTPSLPASTPISLPRITPNLLNPRKSHPSPNHPQSPQPASILSPSSTPSLAASTSIFLPRITPNLPKPTVNSHPSLRSGKYSKHYLNCNRLQRIMYNFSHIYPQLDNLPS